MMEILDNFHFLRPAWLLLVLPAVLLWWFWRRVEDPLRGWREQMEPELLEALATGDRGGTKATGMVLVAWVAAIVVVAGPAWKPEPSPFAEDASPLVILFKADASMEKTDVLPSRLERAQLKIKDLAEARKGQPLALIAYAGSAHLVLPPTKDTDVVAQMASEISSKIMPSPGDRLDLAIAKAGEILFKQESQGSFLIVADTADGDMAAVESAYKKVGTPPVSILAANEEDTSEAESLRMLASKLDAELEQLSPDSKDVESIVRHAARTPRLRSGSGEAMTRWQEGGWYLVPVIAAIVALSFRRQENQNGGEKSA